MRWLLCVSFLLVASLPAAAQENEAEKLFRAMEKKIAAAKTMAVDFHLKLEAGAETIDGRGSVTTASGNKLKLTISIKDATGSMQITMVSDGKKAVTKRVGNGAPELEERPIHENGAKLLASALGRGGLFVAERAMRRAMVDNPKADLDRFTVSDFKLGGKEGVNGRAAQLIEYTLLADGKERKETCKLWIDVETQVPLKRELTVSDNDKKLVCTETYYQWQVDPKVDEKEFVLPK
jgi:outer membrane lipoprotein-sorting protein